LSRKKKNANWEGGRVDSKKNLVNVLKKQKQKKRGGTIHKHTPRFLPRQNNHILLKSNDAAVEVEVGLLEDMLNLVQSTD
jgi:hypothetical protein